MASNRKASLDESLAVTADSIERRIHLIRGQRVMLDSDLADLYDVTTAALNQQVKRNLRRFPEDFAFQLGSEEFKVLISQNVTSKPGRGGRRKLPWAFTEQGVAMLSSVLHSDRAADVNVAIMRVFVRLREMLATHEVLARKLHEMEKRYDAQFKVIFDAIRSLMEPPPARPKRAIGFRVKPGETSSVPLKRPPEP